MAVVFSSVFPAGCAERHSRLSRIAAKRGPSPTKKKRRVPMKIASEISKVAPERTKVAFGSTSRSSSATELPSPPLPSHGNHIAELPGYGNMGDRGTGVTYTLITVVPDEVSSFDKDGGQDVSVSSSSGTAPDQIPAAVVVALPDPVAPVVAPSAAPVLVPLAPRPVRRLFWRRCGIAVNLFWARCSMVRRILPGRWLAAC